MAFKITQHRRGTLEEWLASDIVPYEGELVIVEFDGSIRKCKIGDGVTVFSELPYITDWLVTEFTDKLDALQEFSEAGLSEAVSGVYRKITDVVTQLSDDINLLRSDMNTEVVSLQSSINALAEDINDVDNAVRALIDPAVGELDAKYSDELCQIVSKHEADKKAIAETIEVKTGELASLIGVATATSDSKFADMLAAATDTITADLTDKLSVLSEENTELQASLSNVEQVVSQHTSAINRLQSSVDCIDALVDNKIDEKVTASEETTKASLAELREAIGCVYVTIDELQNSFKPYEAMAEFSLARTATSTDTAALENLAEQLNIIKYKVATLANDYSLTKTEVQTISIEVASLTASVSELLEQQKHGSNTLAKALSELDERSSKADSDIITAMTAHTSEINSEIAKLTAADVLLYQAIAKAKDELTKKIDGINNELADELTDDIARINANVSDVKDQLNTRVTQIYSTVTENIASTKADILKKLDSNETAQNTKLDASINAINDISIEFATNKANVARTLSTVTTDIASSKTNIANNSAAINNMRGELTSTTAKLESSITTLSSRIDNDVFAAENRLQTQITTLDSTVQEQASAIVKVRDTVSDLIEELDHRIDTKISDSKVSINDSIVELRTAITQIKAMLEQTEVGSCDLTGIYEILENYSDEFKDLLANDNILYQLISRVRDNVFEAITDTTNNINDNIAAYKLEVSNRFDEVINTFNDSVKTTENNIIEQLDEVAKQASDATTALYIATSTKIAENEEAIDNLKVAISENKASATEAFNELNTNINLNTAGITKNNLAIKQANSSLTTATDNLNTKISILDTKIGGLRDRVSLIESLDSSTVYDPENGYLTDQFVEEIAAARLGHNSVAEAITSVSDRLYDLEANLPDYIPSNTVDDLFYENNILQLMSQGQPVGNPITIVGGATGDGGDGYSLRVNVTGSRTLAISTIGDTAVSASFIETYEGESTNLPGTVKIEYKLTAASADEWRTYMTLTEVEQDTTFGLTLKNSTDICDLLSTGKQVQIKFTVTGSASDKTSSVTFGVTLVDAKISTVNNTNYTDYYTSDFTFKYKCQGINLKKIVYFEIDDDIPYTVDVGDSHFKTEEYTIPLSRYNYGAHTLTVYFKTNDGAISNKLQYILLYDDGSSQDPMLGVVNSQPTITYGDTLEPSLVVYTPGKETTDKVVVTTYSYDSKSGNKIVYGHSTLTDIDNKKVTPVPIPSYPESGTAYVEFVCNDIITKTIEVLVNEGDSHYDTKPVSAGLVYSYDPRSFSNNSADKDVYEFKFNAVGDVEATVETTFENFNWVSNGYVYDADDAGALVLSGDAQHTIKLPIFSTKFTDKNGKEISLSDGKGNGAPTAQGRTIEFDFKVSNVTNITAPIIKCLSGIDKSKETGFVIAPQLCYITYNDKPVNYDEATGFIWNEANVAATYLNDNTRVRVAFVIEPIGSVTYNDGKSTSQCLNIYINGQFANSCVYKDDANFTQSEYISIGSNTCITKLYDVRIYNRGLSTDEILKNYNSSSAHANKEVSFSDNDMLDNSGNVDYNKAIKKYPCLLITGPLSTYTLAANADPEAGKVNSGVTLTKPDFDDTDVGYHYEFNLLDKDNSGKWCSSNKIQGTTSKRYPIKNYKVYLAKKDDSTGKSTKVKYHLKGEELSIGESTLCWKCDFMSTDHANTFNANLADTLFSDVTEAQKEDPRVQNTIYGFRCLLFQRDNEESEIKFMGDGALNNDKSNAATFGLKVEGDTGNNTTRQKWEFRNNVELICKFQSDALYKPVETKTAAYMALESTYPDQGDLEAAGLAADYRYIQTAFTWVCQRANFLQDGLTAEERALRKNIFINEFEKHFNKHHALVYYLFSEYTALCDNRAKNMFLRCENVKKEQLRDRLGNLLDITDIIDTTTGQVDANQIDWEKSDFAVWLTDLYDLDSCYGVENAGYIQIPYYADWTFEFPGEGKKFNGHDSVFWLMFEEAFANEIKTTAQALNKKKNGLSYANFYDMHIGENALQVCPAIINKDMAFKYHDTWVNGFIDYSQKPEVVQHESIFKYLQRGDRSNQKASFMKKRFNMLNSKYLCDDFTNNNISFRCGEEIASEDIKVTLTANQVFYPAFTVGENSPYYCGSITAPNTAKTVESTSGTSITGNDFIYIPGASFLTDIGDLSKFYPYQLTVTAGVGLKTLKVGSTDEGYENNKLQGINVSQCPLLEELNIMGCTGFTDAVDLTENHLLRKLWASADIKLPTGGILEEVYFGDLSTIRILNQPNISTFEYPNRTKLTKLWIENTPAIHALAIAIERASQLSNGIRLIGINETVDIDDLLKLTDDNIKGTYIDKNGLLTGEFEYPVISGTVHVSSLTGDQYKKVHDCYPDLVITYDAMDSEVIFNYHDSSNEQKEHKVPVAVENSGCADITVPEFADGGPCWRENAAFTYTFVGWSEKEQSLVSPESPNLEDDAIYETDDKLAELFPDAINGSSLTNINGNRLLYPVFKANRKEYTVKFYNETTEGRKLLYSTTVSYGYSADYVGDDPVKETLPEPERFAYSFVGWSKDTSCITGNTDCVAQFVEDQFTLEDVDYKIETADDGKEVLVITGCKNKYNDAVTIPDTLTDGINTYEVVSLGGFNRYYDLKFIKLPETLIGLENEAFAYCSALSKITIPANITKIPQRAFTWCESLTEVTLPAGLTELGATCFGFCANLSKVNFEDLVALQKILTYAFDGSAITDVIIPSTVDAILDHAFGDIESLRTVTFIGTDPSKIELHKDAFKDSGTEENPITFNLPWSEEQHNAAVAGGKFNLEAKYANFNFNYTGGNN